MHQRGLFGNKRQLDLRVFEVQECPFFLVPSFSHMCPSQHIQTLEKKTTLMNSQVSKPPADFPLTSQEETDSPSSFSLFKSKNSCQPPFHKQELSYFFFFLYCLPLEANL